MPLKYHHVISQQGNFFRTLRSFGVHVDISGHPQKSAVPPQPLSTSATTPSARIDDSESALEILWEVIPNYQDAEEGSSIWTIKARDEAGMERAQNAIKDAIVHAELMSHVGFLTLPDRTMFPRIVGSKGSNVARLRNETGADITVSRENNTIVIIGTRGICFITTLLMIMAAGTEHDILSAKEAIVRMATNPNRGPRRHQD